MEVAARFAQEKVCHCSLHLDLPASPVSRLVQVLRVRCLSVYRHASLVLPRHLDLSMLNRHDAKDGSGCSGQLWEVMMHAWGCEQTPGCGMHLLTAEGLWGMCKWLAADHSKVFFSGCHCTAVMGYCTAVSN